MRPLLLAALVALSGCWLIPSWPEIPETPRTFHVTACCEDGAPWGDVEWSTIAFVDEPLLGFAPGTFCSRLDELAARLDAARATGKLVWLNWSTEELIAALQCGPYPGFGADVVSFDSYGGPWDWHVKTEAMLDTLHAHLAPGQQMAVIPEAYRWSTNDLLLVNALYFDWAMRHDRVFAFAPWPWRGGEGYRGVADDPVLNGFLARLAAEHPLR